MSFFLIVAGLPATSTPDGTSFVTTEPAAITLISPTFTPGRMIAFAPTQTLSPILTGAVILGYMSANLFQGEFGLALVRIVTPYAKVEFSPISIVSFASKKTPLFISECACRMIFEWLPIILQSLDNLPPPL